MRYTLLRCLLLMLTLPHLATAQELMISGTISDIAGDPAEFPITVFLTGDANLTTLTNDEGYYEFTGLQVEGNYSVRPSFEGFNEDICLTIGDICILEAYLNNAIELTPSQLIQADVNADGSVDNNDLIRLRQAVLEGSAIDTPTIIFDWINPEFPTELSGLSTFTFTNLIDFGTADFRYLPKGDLTQGCPDTGVSPNSLDLSLSGPTNIAPGENFCIDVLANTYSNLSGFEVALSWTSFNCSFENVVQNTSLPGQFTFVSDQSSFTATYQQTANGSLPSGTVLFSLCFDAGNIVNTNINIGFADRDYPILALQEDCSEFTGSGNGNGPELQIPIVPLIDCDLEPIFTFIGTDVECCYNLGFNDIDPFGDAIFGIRLTTLDGNTIVGNGVPGPGVSMNATGNTIREFTTDDGSGFGGTGDFYSFCFGDIVSIPQLVKLEFLADDLQTVICTDTLISECAVNTSGDCENAVSSLNISSGIDAAGIPLTNGTVDPQWEFMNAPPLNGPTPSGISLPDAFAIREHFSSWNTLDLPSPLAKVISPRSAAAFSVNNLDIAQPWRARRQFCICEETEVTIAGATQADDQGIIHLYRDDNPSVSLGQVGNSYLYDGSQKPFKQDSAFSFTTVLAPGSYHLEYELLNRGRGAMGFILGAEITTPSGEPLIVEKGPGCQFGTITLQKLNDLNCNGERDPKEGSLNGWTFNLRDTTTNTTYTGVTDVFGEVIFRLLPYGTYEVTELIQAPWMASSQLPIYVTVDENGDTKVVDILNKSPESCSCIDADIFSIPNEDPNSENCCYEVRISNEFGPYYDSIAVIGAGLSPTLLSQLATYGTVSTAGDTIYVSGLVPEVIDLPLLQFCIEAEGRHDVEILWFHQGEVVCDDLYPVECPDDCNGFQAENTSQDDCCIMLDFDNIGNDVINALSVRVINGATIDGSSVSFPVDHQIIGSNSTSRTIARLDGTPLGANVDSLIGFCLHEVTTPTQTIVIDYLGRDYATIVCSDTLMLECPVSPSCLQVLEETVTLDCENDSLRLQMLMVKPMDYIDSVGLIKVIIRAPSNMDTTLVYDLTNAPLYPGDAFSLDEILPYTPLAGEDSLCVLITAHDGPEERVCCFADSLCIPIPICNPCDYYSAEMQPLEEDSCCYYLIVEDFHPQAGYFDSLHLDLISSAAGIASINYLTNGNWAGNPATNDEWSRVAQQSGPDTIAIVCLNEALPPLDTSFFQIDFLHFGDPDTLICSDTLYGTCPMDPVIDMPCDSIESDLLVSEEDSCCYWLVVEELYTQAGYFDSLRLSILSTTAGVRSFSYINNNNWAGNNSSANAEWMRTGQFNGPDTIAFICLEEALPPSDTTIFELDFLHFGDPDTLICSDTLVATCPKEIEPCDSLSAMLELMPIGEDSCCYDVYITNNYSATDISSVTVDLLNGPVSTFGGIQLTPIPTGWNFPTTNVINNSYTFTHSSGNIPLGTTKLFNFCLEESISTDSTYIGVSFQLPEEEICTDTVAAYCPDCAAVVNDTLGCYNNGSYLYRFSFTNLSDSPVNAVRILDAVGSTDPLLNSQIFRLPVTVPIGGTYSGTLPVQLRDLNGDGEFCFDIVLRYILPESDINIECCYINHCIELPSCEELPQFECPNPGFAEDIPLLPELDAPVCGCDLVRYQNWTYAVQAGEIVWYPANADGECIFTLTDDTPSLELFPNPVNNNVLINSSRPGPAQLELINFSGSTGQRKAVNFSNNPIRLDVSHQPPGVYTVIVRYPDGQLAYKKFIKQ